MSGWLQAAATAAAPTVAIALSRVWSHFEHRQTARDVREIKDAVNGVEAPDGEVG